MEFESLKKNYTNINEPARKFLNLSRDEYGFCSYVQYRSSDPRQKIRGWCCDPKQEIAEWVGVSRPGLYKMIDRLEKQNLLETDAKGNISVTAYWIDVENNCKLSLQIEKEDVNLVYKEGSESVNLVTHNKELDKEKESIHENEYTFEQFWNDYGFKVGSKSGARQRFNKLKPLDRKQIKDTLPLYKGDTAVVETKGKDFKKMRKQPEFYITGRMWEAYVDALSERKKEEQVFPEWDVAYNAYLDHVKKHYPKVLQFAKYLSKRQFVSYRTEFYVQGKSFLDLKTEEQILLRAHDKVELSPSQYQDVFSQHCILITERLKINQI